MGNSAHSNLRYVLNALDEIEKQRKTERTKLVEELIRKSNEK